jgi:uncharacterized protein (TIGR02996 family)
MKHTPRQQAELSALLRACKEEPDDMDLRFVLADWLEEHRSADLAECVRLSCQATDLLGDDPRAQGLAALVNDPRRPAGRWLAPLRELFPHTTFHRGLLRVAAIDVALLRRRPDDVPADLRPWLESLHAALTPAPNGLAALADAGWLAAFTTIERPLGLAPADVHALLTRADQPLAHVASLDLGWGAISVAHVERLAAAKLPALRALGLEGNRGLDDEAFRPLLRSPLLEQLTSLNVGYTDIGLATVRWLARSERAGRLRALMLDGTRPGAAGLAELAQGPGLKSLRSLSLVGCGLQVTDLDELSRWRADRPLHALSLWGNGHDSEAFNRLAKWPGLGEVRRLKMDVPVVMTLDGWELFLRALQPGRLEALQLNRAALRDEVGRLIADCPGLANLRSLSMPQGSSSTEALAALAGSPHLGRLEYLGLSTHRLGEAGYRALTTGSPKRGASGASPFPALQSLDLSRTLPARAGLDLLLHSPLMARLRHVHLRENRLGPDGAKALAVAKSVSGLKFLGLWTASLKDEGAEALAASPHLAGLRGLDLQKNNITDRGALALARSEGLAHLPWLSLRLNRVSDAGLRGLVWRPGGWARLAVDHNPCSEEVVARARQVSILD